MTALRQIAANGKRSKRQRPLFTPGETYAIHQGGQNGTPLPHEEPQEVNPPAGVLAYYWLKSTPTRPIKIELIDASGKVTPARKRHSCEAIDTEAINVQAYWEQPPPPSNQAGTHRVSLDVRPARGFGGGGGFGRPAAPPPADACHPASAAPQNPQPRERANRPRAEAGLQPGQYTVRLTVDGQTLTQPVIVKPDPRNIPEGSASTVFSPNANNQ